MKKLLIVSFCFIFLQSRATTWNINVQDFQFVPATQNVVVGDKIHWVFVSGTHTTTSVTIPVGAAPWDALIDDADLSFDYTVTQPGIYSYKCTFHAILGMTASFTATGVMPVNLSAFNISTQNNQPLLSWTTQTESNADYFSIRKSINGIDFKEIGKIPATGNSSISKNYSFSDKAGAPGVNYAYYALATIDKEGQMQLSPIQIYKYKNASRKLITSLSPNPISDMGHIMVQFNADKSGVMTAKLLDMQGKVVLKTELSAERGINNGHIHLGDVQAGVYTIYFSLDGINESYKVVKN